MTLCKWLCLCHMASGAALQLPARPPPAHRGQQSAPALCRVHQLCVRMCVCLYVCAPVRSDRVRMKWWKRREQKILTVCVNISRFQFIVHASALAEWQFFWIWFYLWLYNWKIFKHWVCEVAMENTKYKIVENLYLKIPSVESESSSLETSRRKHFQSDQCSLIIVLLIQCNV